MSTQKSSTGRAGPCRRWGEHGKGKGRVLGESPRGLTLVLPQVFGLQLVEIDTKRPTYILVNNLPRAEGNYLCR